VDWRVDYVLSSSFLAAADTACVRMQLHVQQPASTAVATSSTSEPQAQAPPAEQLVSFSLTPAMFQLLYHDLKQARLMMQHV